MIDSSYLALIQNASLLLALALVFDTTSRIWKSSQTLWMKLVLGVIVGFIGIFVMNTPWIYGQGLIFDTRSILLSLSGLFFGAVPTMIAILMTALYRFSLGGAYVTGISVIFATGLLGIGWRHLRLKTKEKKPLIKIKWWQLYLFGLLVHVVMLLLMLTQPAYVSWPLLQTISVPIILIYPAVSLLLGLLMTNRLRRENVIEENRKSRERLASMIKVTQYAENEPQSFIDFAMEEAVKLTESKMGFIFYYDEDSQKFTVSSWSKTAMELCKIPAPQLVYELEKTGVWGEPVRQRKTLILNQFKAQNPLKKGFPEGHPDIENLLEVPIFSENKIVAVVGMANKATDYDEFDAAQLSLLMEMVWKTEESKKAALALRHSEENYRFLFNQSADGIFISNQAGELQDVNDSGCAMLGYNCDEIKKNFQTLFSDAKEYYINDHLKQTLQVGRSYLSEQKIKNREGELIDLEILTQLLPDGRVQKIVRNISDRKLAEENARKAQQKLMDLLQTADDSRKALLSVIEDQKEIEEALRKSEQSYRNLFENITQGFAVHKILVDEEGKPCDYVFIAANPAYEELTGLKAKEIIGKSVRECLPGVEQKWIDTYGKVALSGNPVRFEDYTAAIGKYYDVGAFSPEPGYFAVIISDITSRKNYEIQIQNFNVNLEKKVKERTEELETANRELESFSYSVSHDLRAPLRSINGFAQIVTEEYNDKLDPDLLRYFNLIRKNASMMGTLVDDLLNFSRLGRQSISRKSVNTSKVVQEVIDFLQPELLLKKIQVQMGDLPDCEADPALLRQVFMNLISNAVKFTDQAANPQIEIGYLPHYKRGQDEVSCYYIKDNGVGFDMKFYDKLFGVFQRLHRAEDYDGTGVGLAIVHRIVEKHGGRVWAEAAIDQGATFYFTLGERENGK